MAEMKLENILEKQPNLLISSLKTSEISLSKKTKLKSQNILKIKLKRAGP